MKLNLKVTEPTKQLKTCQIVGIFEDGSFTPAAKAIDKATQGYLSKLLKQGTFSGKMGQTLAIYQPAGSNLEHVLFVGCGKADKLTNTTFRKIIFAATKALILTRATLVTSYLTELTVGKQSLAWKVKQIAEATIDGLYRFDHFKSEKEPAINIKEFAIAIPDLKHEEACELALEQGHAIAISMAFTKNLANLPSNLCTPTFLAQQAKSLAKEYRSLSITVLDRKHMEKLGMGALLGVAQGSAEEPKLIALEYKGAAKNQAPIALVGKGVTFDTGGNSLKAPESMVGMKYDMCGAATVLGVIKAAAELKLPINVVGVIAAVENMPGGTAYKPEDILTSMSGQTIEVISTDAEGRVILADALTYCERFKPKAVIDIATLTGAVVIALGHHATGLLANDEDLAQDLLRAGVESNDRAWQLPLWDEYQEQIKSPFADISNTGGRSGGSITAACFLSRFTKKFKWAHLDVAGTAAIMFGNAERMATGRPVPLLVQYLIDQASE